MFVGFLGLGQGGGNIADEAARNGFYSAAINYSQRDLDSLEHIELKLKLVGSEGIGKQRTEAIRLMNNNWDLATNFVTENFSHSSIEIIFVPFSTGGGSGSGIAPVILSLLTEAMPDKVFVAMPILPDKKESYTNQRNCLDTFEDLSQLNICTIPIDNDKPRALLNNIGKSNLYKNVNERTVSLIKKAASYTDQYSKNGVLDKKDLKTIFSTSGIATLSEANLTTLSNSFELSESSFAEKIQKSWNQSPFVDIELNQIISAGIIFDGQEKLMESINMEKIFTVFGNKMPISIFEGYYHNENGFVLSILSGLSWCNNRLEEIDKTLEDNSINLNSINENNQTYKSRTADLLKIKSKNTPNKQPKVNDISNIINKFKR